MSLIWNEAPYPHWQFIKDDSGDSLSIVPERGGLITEWFCNGRNLLYFDHDRYLDPAKSIRGGMPVLFPICGNLPGDLLVIEGKNYELSQHGFARDLEWDLNLLEDQSGILMSFESNAFTRSIYPFSFRLEMVLRLQVNSLECQISIYNLDKIIMPFSFGLHPYFKVMNLEDVFIEGLPETCIDQKGMVESETLTQLQYLVKGVDFLTAPSSFPIALIDRVAGYKLELHYFSPLDLAVVWTDPPRPTVCVEPWTSPRQALITNDRKLELAPGSNQKLRCMYKLVDYCDTPGSLPTAS